MTGFRAIALDLWYTAFLRTPDLDRRWEEARRRALGELIRPGSAPGRSPADVLSADRALETDLMSSGRNPDTVAPPEYLRQLADRTGGTVVGPIDRASDRYSLAGLSSDPPIVNPELLRLGERLRESRVPWILITNTHRSGTSLQAFFREHARTSFDAVVTSCDVGVRKPALAIFRRAAERLGLAPGEVLHVGDRFDSDVLGAIGAGMGAALYTGYWDRYPRDSEEARVRDATPTTGAVERVNDLEHLSVFV